ncbi:MAG: 30S ribosomal protein S4 [Sphaerobacter sp.]|nr:30S ribosomal protein S4 [Sphaerobacter sp.]
MARYTGPKHKRSRREGVNLTGTRSRSLERRLKTPPGAHAHARPRRMTEYGRQLREKQKLKRHFGMLEKQFRRTFDDARRSNEPTGTAFVKLLESRLDNVVYRLGFCPTRPMARQLVNHGHVLVNGRRVNIPSYRVSPGDTIALTEKAAAMPAVQEALQDAGRQIPSWLAREGTEPRGRVVSEPNPEELDIPVDLDLIVAFYAR